MIKNVLRGHISSPSPSMCFRIVPNPVIFSIVLSAQLSWEGTISQFGHRGNLILLLSQNQIWKEIRAPKIWGNNCALWALVYCNRVY